MAKKKKSKLKHLYILIFVVVTLGLGYIYIENLEKQTPQSYVPAPLVGDKDNPQYAIVDNPDSLKYQIVIIYNQNIGINEIASTFYNNEKFWPYIYLENKDKITDPLNITKDVVLRIPRLSYKSIDVNDQKSIDRVRTLADSILSSAPSINSSF